MSQTSAPILLIEEERTLLEITAFRLEMLGYRVIAFQKASEANAWLKDHMPHLIAVGNMTDMDSVDFLEQLSNDERTNLLPTIYLSASSDLDEVQRAFNAGADEYLVTPYDPLVMEKKVEGLLQAVACRNDE